MSDKLDLDRLLAEKDVSPEPTITADDLQEPPAPVPGGRIQPVLHPVMITTKAGNQFNVTELNAWGYCPIGVYAVGKWEGYDDEKDVLIPFTEVKLYTFDYEATDRLIKESKEAKDAGDSPSD